MTRFARAKGSKASNERLPEDSTSWQEMKRGMIKTSNNRIEALEDESESLKASNCSNNNNNTERHANNTTIANIKTPVKWSEFPILDQINLKHKNTNNGHDYTKRSKAESKKRHKTKGINVIVSKHNTDAQQNEATFKEIGNVENTSGAVAKKKSKKTNAKVDHLNESQEMESNSEISAKKKDAKRKKSISNLDESEEHNSNFVSRKKNKKQKLHLNNEKSPEEISNVASINDNKNPYFGRNKTFPTKGKKHNKQFSKAQIEETPNKTSFRKSKFKEEHKRRKPNSQVNKIMINGNEVEISYYDGFPIKKEDAERLKELKKEMINKGLPRSEVAKALKLERRKSEKALAREKKKVCFNCRSSGHNLSECPSLKSGSNAQLTETGICFKCGSTEHTHFECKVTRGDNFKFAQCFICKEQGHIARQCPDNNKGLYPKGGACRVCGDVTHLKKDCPKYQSQQEEKKIVADIIDDNNIESLDNEAVTKHKKSKNLQKIIKF